MPKPSKLQLILNHLDNIEMAMNDKSEALMAAADQIIDIRRELFNRGSRAPDLAAIKGELFDIWNSVMDTPYDEDF